ncbi:MAG: peptidylprolyl isomerase [Fimbriimonadaceae bacterium]|nr:peptidylprolyl isomerase [Fimbriimonadaceae bacterium]
MKRLILLISLGVLGGSLMTGCAPEEPDANAPDNTPVVSNEPAVTEPEPTPTITEAAPISEGAIELGADGTPKTSPPGVQMPKAGDDVAVIQTNHGDIWLRFFPDKAPKHVKNFLDLAKSGFYDGTKFHRVIPDFMIQGGDPNSKNDDRSDDGTGGNMKDGAEVNVPAEFNDTSHTRGILSMARSNDPNSASSQFFIVVKDSNFLDGQYSAFGMAFAGMDVADKIKELPRDPNDNPLEANPATILKVVVMKWDEKYLKKAEAAQ